MTDHSPLRQAVLKLLDDAAAPYPHFLEQRFPHVLQRMLALWDKPQFDTFVDSLLCPTKTTGAGFPEQAIIEIQSIRNFCASKAMPAVTETREILPVRETLLPFLGFDHAVYPATLEKRFPHVLQEILWLLGKPEINEYLDNLLSSSAQLKHGFCEQALIEIMTLKAIHRRKQTADASPINAAPEQAADNEAEHVASQVFDRVQRW